jgi:hypothetical protein
MRTVRGFATASLLAVGVGGSAVGLIGGASIASAATTAPSSTACGKADVVIVSRNADLTTVSVRLAAASAHKSCDVSLHSYQTEGATWATSGNQAVVGFATAHLTATAQTLTVAGSTCFGQSELVLGTQKHDGTDGALPHYPNGVFGSSVLASWSGGKACSPTTNGGTPPPTTTTITPTGVLPEQFTTQPPPQVVPVSVLGETVVKPPAAAPKAQLPFTGQPIATEVAAGAILIGLGALVIAAGRRRETDIF